MKKLLLLITSAVILSCSSDSSSSDSDNALIGKWTQEKESVYVNSSLVSETFNSDEECYQMTTYEYKSNNSFVKVSFDFETNTCVQNPTRTGTWSLSGDNLSISVDGASETLVLFSATETVLKLKTVLSETAYSIVEYSKVD